MNHSAVGGAADAAESSNPRRSPCESRFSSFTASSVASLSSPPSSAASRSRERAAADQRREGGVEGGRWLSRAEKSAAPSPLNRPSGACLPVQAACREAAFAAAARASPPRQHASGQGRTPSEGSPRPSAGASFSARALSESSSPPGESRPEVAWVAAETGTRARSPDEAARERGSSGSSSSPPGTMEEDEDGEPFLSSRRRDPVFPEAEEPSSRLAYDRVSSSPGVAAPSPRRGGACAESVCASSAASGFAAADARDSPEAGAERPPRSPVSFAPAGYRVSSADPPPADPSAASPECSGSRRGSTGAARAVAGRDEAAGKPGPLREVSPSVCFSGGVCSSSPILPSGSSPESPVSCSPSAPSSSPAAPVSSKWPSLSTSSSSFQSVAAASGEGGTLGAQGRAAARAPRPSPEAARSAGEPREGLVGSPRLKQGRSHTSAEGGRPSTEPEADGGAEVPRVDPEGVETSDENATGSECVAGSESPVRQRHQSGSDAVADRVPANSSRRAIEGVEAAGEELRVHEKGNDEENLQKPVHVPRAEVLLAPCLLFLPGTFACPCGEAAGLTGAGSNVAQPPPPSSPSEALAAGVPGAAEAGARQTAPAEVPLFAGGVSSCPQPAGRRDATEESGNGGEGRAATMSESAAPNTPLTQAADIVTGESEVAQNTVSEAGARRGGEPRVKTERNARVFEVGEGTGSGVGMGKDREQEKKRSGGGRVSRDEEPLATDACERAERRVPPRQATPFGEQGKDEDLLRTDCEPPSAPSTSRLVELSSSCPSFGFSSSTSPLPPQSSFKSPSNVSLTPSRSRRVATVSADPGGEPRQIPGGAEEQARRSSSPESEEGPDRLVSAHFFGAEAFGREAEGACEWQEDGSFVSAENLPSASSVLPSRRVSDDAEEGATARCSSYGSVPSPFDSRQESRDSAPHKAGGAAARRAESRLASRGPPQALAAAHCLAAAVASRRGAAHAGQASENFPSASSQEFWPEGGHSCASSAATSSFTQNDELFTPAHTSSFHTPRDLLTLDACDVPGNEGALLARTEGEPCDGAEKDREGAPQGGRARAVCHEAGGNAQAAVGSPRREGAADRRADGARMTVEGRAGGARATGANAAAAAKPDDAPAAGGQQKGTAEETPDEEASRDEPVQARSYSAPVEGAQRRAQKPEEDARTAPYFADQISVEKRPQGWRERDEQMNQAAQDEAAEAALRGEGEADEGRPTRSLGEGRRTPHTMERSAGGGERQVRGEEGSSCSLGEKRARSPLPPGSGSGTPVTGTGRRRGQSASPQTHEPNGEAGPSQAAAVSGGGSPVSAQGATAFENGVEAGVGGAYEPARPRSLGTMTGEECASPRSCFSGEDRAEGSLRAAGGKKKARERRRRNQEAKTLAAADARQAHCQSPGSPVSHTTESAEQDSSPRCLEVPKEGGRLAHAQSPRGPRGEPGVAPQAGPSPALSLASRRVSAKSPRSSYTGHVSSAPASAESPTPSAPARPRHVSAPDESLQKASLGGASPQLLLQPPAGLSQAVSSLHPSLSPYHRTSLQHQLLSPGAAAASPHGHLAAVSSPLQVGHTVLPFFPLSPVAQSAPPSSSRYPGEGLSGATSPMAPAAVSASLSAFSPVHATGTGGSAFPAAAVSPTAQSCATSKSAGLPTERGQKGGQGDSAARAAAAANAAPSGRASGVDASSSSSASSGSTRDVRPAELLHEGVSPSAVHQSLQELSQQLRHQHQLQHLQQQLLLAAQGSAGLAVGAHNLPTPLGAGAGRTCTPAVAAAPAPVPLGGAGADRVPPARNAERGGEEGEPARGGSRSAGSIDGVGPARAGGRADSWGQVAGSPVGMPPSGRTHVPPSSAAVAGAALAVGGGAVPVSAGARGAHAPPSPAVSLPSLPPLSLPMLASVAGRSSHGLPPTVFLPQNFAGGPLAAPGAVSAAAYAGFPGLQAGGYSRPAAGVGYSVSPPFAGAHPKSTFSSPPHQVCRILLLSEQLLQQLLHHVTPSASARDEKRLLYNSLVHFVHNILGSEVSLYLAGSTAYDVDAAGSDLDVVLLDRSSPSTDARGILQHLRAMIEAVQQQLLHSGESALGSDWPLRSVQLQLVDSARVPILTLRTPDASVVCDISVNTSNSIWHSEFFSFVLQQRPQLRPLMRLLKVWVRNRKLPTMKEGGLPSIVWMMLAVHLCQGGQQRLLGANGALGASSGGSRTPNAAAARRAGENVNAPSQGAAGAAAPAPGDGRGESAEAEAAAADAAMRRRQDEARAGPGASSVPSRRAPSNCASSPGGGRGGGTEDSRQMPAAPLLSQLGLQVGSGLSAARLISPLGFLAPMVGLPAPILPSFFPLLLSLFQFFAHLRNRSCLSQSIFISCSPAAASAAAAAASAFGRPLLAPPAAVASPAPVASGQAQKASHAGAGGAGDDRWPADPALRHVASVPGLVSHESQYASLSHGGASQFTNSASQRDATAATAGGLGRQRASSGGAGVGTGGSSLAGASESAPLLVSSTPKPKREAASRIISSICHGGVWDDLLSVFDYPKTNAAYLHTLGGGGSLGSLAGVPAAAAPGAASAGAVGVGAAAGPGGESEPAVDLAAKVSSATWLVYLYELGRAAHLLDSFLKAVNRFHLLLQVLHSQAANQHLQHQLLHLRALQQQQFQQSVVKGVSASPSCASLASLPSVSPSASSSSACSAICSAASCDGGDSEKAETRKEEAPLREAARTANDVSAPVRRLGTDGESESGAEEARRLKRASVAASEDGEKLASVAGVAAATPRPHSALSTGAVAGCAATPGALTTYPFTHELQLFRRDLLMGVAAIFDEISDDRYLLPATYEEQAPGVETEESDEDEDLFSSVFSEQSEGEENGAKKNDGGNRSAAAAPPGGGRGLQAQGTVGQPLGCSTPSLYASGSPAALFLSRFLAAPDQGLSALADAVRVTVMRPATLTSKVWLLAVLEGRLCVIESNKTCQEGGWWSTQFLSRRDVRSTLHGRLYLLVGLQPLQRFLLRARHRRQLLEEEKRKKTALQASGTVTGGEETELEAETQGPEGDARDADAKAQGAGEQAVRGGVAGISDSVEEDLASLDALFPLSVSKERRSSNVAAASNEPAAGADPLEPQEDEEEEASSFFSAEGHYPTLLVPVNPESVAPPVLFSPCNFVTRLTVLQCTVPSSLARPLLSLFPSLGASGAPGSTGKSAAGRFICMLPSWEMARVSTLHRIAASSPWFHSTAAKHRNLLHVGMRAPLQPTVARCRHCLVSGVATASGLVDQTEKDVRHTLLTSLSSSVVFDVDAAARDAQSSKAAAEGVAASRSPLATALPRSGSRSRETERDEKRTLAALAALAVAAERSETAGRSSGPKGRKGAAPSDGGAQEVSRTSEGVERREDDRYSGEQVQRASGGALPTPPAASRGGTAGGDAAGRGGPSVPALAAVVPSEGMPAGGLWGVGLSPALAPHLVAVPPPSPVAYEAVSADLSRVPSSSALAAFPGSSSPSVQALGGKGGAQPLVTTPSHASPLPRLPAKHLHPNVALSSPLGGPHQLLVTPQSPVGATEHSPASVGSTSSHGSAGASGSCASGAGPASVLAAAPPQLLTSQAAALAPPSPSAATPAAPPAHPVVLLMPVTPQQLLVQHQQQLLQQQMLQQHYMQQQLAHVAAVAALSGAANGPGRPLAAAALSQPVVRPPQPMAAVAAGGAANLMGTQGRGAAGCTPCGARPAGAAGTAPAGPLAFGGAEGAGAAVAGGGGGFQANPETGEKAHQSGFMYGGGPAGANAQRVGRNGVTGMDSRRGSQQAFLQQESQPSGGAGFQVPPSAGTPATPRAAQGVVKLASTAGGVATRESSSAVLNVPGSPATSGGPGKASSPGRASSSHPGAAREAGGDGSAPASSAPGWAAGASGERGGHLPGRGASGLLRPQQQDAPFARHAAQPQRAAQALGHAGAERASSPKREERDGLHLSHVRRDGSAQPSVSSHSSASSLVDEDAASVGSYYRGSHRGEDGRGVSAASAAQRRSASDVAWTTGGPAGASEARGPRGGATEGGEGYDELTRGDSRQRAAYLPQEQQGSGGVGVEGGADEGSSAYGSRAARAERTASGSRELSPSATPPVGSGLGGVGTSRLSSSSPLRSSFASPLSNESSAPSHRPFPLTGSDRPRGALSSSVAAAALAARSLASVSASPVLPSYSRSLLSTTCVPSPSSIAVPSSAHLAAGVAVSPSLLSPSCDSPRRAPLHASAEAPEEFARERRAAEERIGRKSQFSSAYPEGAAPGRRRLGSAYDADQPSPECMRGGELQPRESRVEAGASAGSVEARGPPRAETRSSVSSSKSTESFLVDRRTNFSDPSPSVYGEAADRSARRASGESVSSGGETASLHTAALGSRSPALDGARRARGAGRGAGPEREDAGGAAAGEAVDREHWKLRTSSSTNIRGVLGQHGRAEDDVAGSLSDESSREGRSVAGGLSVRSCGGGRVDAATRTSTLRLFRAQSPSTTRSVGSSLPAPANHEDAPQPTAGSSPPHPGACASGENAAAQGAGGAHGEARYAVERRTRKEATFPGARPRRYSQGSPRDVAAGAVCLSPVGQFEEREVSSAPAASARLEPSSASLQLNECGDADETSKSAPQLPSPPSFKDTPTASTPSEVGAPHGNDVAASNSSRRVARERIPLKHRAEKLLYVPGALRRQKMLGQQGAEGGQSCAPAANSVSSTSSLAGHSSDSLGTCGGDRGGGERMPPLSPCSSLNSCASGGGYPSGERDRAGASLSGATGSAAGFTPHASTSPYASARGESRRMSSSATPGGASSPRTAGSEGRSSASSPSGLGLAPSSSSCPVSRHEVQGARGGSPGVTGVFGGYRVRRSASGCGSRASSQESSLGRGGASSVVSASTPATGRWTSARRDPSSRERLFAGRGERQGTGEYDEGRRAHGGGETARAGAGPWSLPRVSLRTTTARVSSLRPRRAPRRSRGTFPIIRAQKAAAARAALQRAVWRRRRSTEFAAAPQQRTSGVLTTETAEAREAARARARCL
ncbi:hypothetical protein BESB_085600 [Besnoitia besnoiti]|uniref:Poly(A) RNA polymerase mitochondrial-like central palm domain-containing protein n=1 Tax=Besnoitia besnoiti TaxID=94643 RepID=A0A2A9MAM9_BESBE|nr:hypothetical protein BESB_085600 [Besnoitia besnoiti]PFH33361.1 hypothetical protein BESB_085600 [Besnoitia besnoiti]